MLYLCFCENFNFIPMAKYIKQEMPDIQGKGENKSYYRMQTVGKLSMEEFVRNVAKPGSGLSEGEVLHVLSETVRELAYSLANGYTVSIEGLGHFSTSLQVKQDKEMDSIDGPEPKRNAQSIEVGNVNFRVDKQLVHSVNGFCRLERGKVNRLLKSPFEKQKRLEKALLLIKQQGFIRVAEYKDLVHISHTSASRELREFAADPKNKLTHTGRGPSKVYVMESDIDSE